MFSRAHVSAVGVVVLICSYCFSPPMFTAREKPKQKVGAPDNHPDKPKRRQEPPTALSLFMETAEAGTEKHPDPTSFVQESEEHMEKHPDRTSLVQESEEAKTQIISGSSTSSQKNMQIRRHSTMSIDESEAGIQAHPHPISFVHQAEEKAKDRTHHDRSSSVQESEEKVKDQTRRDPSSVAQKSKEKGKDQTQHDHAGLAGKPQGDVASYIASFVDTSETKARDSHSRRRQSQQYTHEGSVDLERPQSQDRVKFIHAELAEIFKQHNPQAQDLVKLFKQHNPQSQDLVKFNEDARTPEDDLPQDLGSLVSKGHGAQSQDRVKFNENPQTPNVVEVSKGHGSLSQDRAKLNENSKDDLVSTFSEKSSGKAEEPQVMLQVMTKRNPAVCVFGSNSEGYTDLTVPLGKMIAEKGFDLITDRIGGNMDSIRQTFFTTEGRAGKSLWRPPKKLSDWSGQLPENVDEALESESKGNYIKEEYQIDKADCVVALPGGPYVEKQVKETLEKGKPIIGFITDDSVTERTHTGQEILANEIVKKALPESYYLSDISKVEEFLNKYAPKAMAEDGTKKKGAKKSPNSARLQNVWLSPISILFSMLLLA